MIDFPPHPLQPVPAVDYGRLAEMAEEIWKSYYPGIITMEQCDYMLERMYSEDQISSDIARGIVYCWITDQERDWGFAAFGPLQQGNICEIHKIYLLDAARGRGLGKSAMIAIETHAAGAGATELELRVNRENTGAIAFYEAFGFRRHAEDCKDIGNGYVMDDFILRKRILSGHDLSS